VNLIQSARPQATTTAARGCLGVGNPGIRAADGPWSRGTVGRPRGATRALGAGLTRPPPRRTLAPRAPRLGNPRHVDRLERMRNCAIAQMRTSGNLSSKVGERPPRPARPTRSSARLRARASLCLEARICSFAQRGAHRELRRVGEWRHGWALRPWRGRAGTLSRGRHALMLSTRR